jgi:S1-C subfamily serine protease
VNADGELIGLNTFIRLDTSRASELALTSGDVVHAVNGAWVTTPAELREALARFETGDAVVLQVERKGELTYLAFDME